MNLQTLRGPTVYDFVIFDNVATIAAAAAIHWYAGSFVVVLIVLYLGAVFVHWLTSTPTMLNYYLGLNTIDAVHDKRNVAESYQHTSQKIQT